jgi:hypothetical protein
MWRVVIIACIIFHPSLAEKVPVVLQKHVADYISGFRTNNAVDYRSGLLTGGDSLFDDTITIRELPEGKVLKPREIRARWCGARENEFSIQYRDPLRSLPWMRQALDKLGLKNAVYDSSVRILFATNFDSSRELFRHVNDCPDQAIDEKELESRARRMISRALPALKGRIEFECADKEYSDGRLSQMHVRFRRIFLGGIVMDDISYAKMSLLKNGELLSCELKWPAFEKIEKLHRAIGIDSALAEARAIFEETPEAAMENNPSARLRPKSISLAGAALGWRMTLESSAEVLTPCYLFKGEVRIEDDSTKLERFIQIPRLTKYFR